MPGILGYIGEFGQSQERPGFLERMADALEPASRFSKELYQGNGLGIGRASLGITNSDPQPFWTEDGSLCLVMEGELFDYDAAKKDLIDRGYQFQTESDGEFLLYLFEQYGEAAVKNLNGAFVAAIWNKQQRKLTLINDRLGLHPLYYTQTKEGFLFASAIRSLLSFKGLEKTVDEVAMAQFLTFDHLLGQRTLLQNVCLLPQGSVLNYHDGRYAIRSYWSPAHPHQYELVEEVEWMELFNERMREAVARQYKEDQPIGLLLSGGLDSRYLLADLNELTGEQALQTYTWGIPGCNDARAAKKVASLTGNQNHFFELKPDWLLDKASEAIRITEGLGNIINFHALATLEEETKETQILFKGFLGDAMMGFALRPQLWAEYDDDTRIKAHLQVHRDQGVITFDFEEQKKLFRESFQYQIGTAVVDTYRAGMDESGSTLLADQRIFFDYRQRVARMTINGVELARSRAVVRLPFADNDLIDLAISLPPGWRYQRRLMRNAFIRAYPKLAQVPLANTGLPMMACLRDIQIRAGRWVRWRLNSRGLPVNKVSHRPYKDYNTWFRTVLRSWVEETLLDDRAQDQNLWPSG